MAQVLLLGPERDRAGGLRALLRRDGHTVEWVRDLRNAHDAERECRPELIVAAVGECERPRFEPPRAIRRFPAPMLLVQPESGIGADPYDERRLVDRIRSPFMREELLARVDALIRVRRVIERHPDAPREAPGVDDVPTTLTARIGSWLRNRLPEECRPNEPYLEVAARVADWADRRDAFEPGHAERVASFCAMMAESLGMPDEETDALLRAAMLHDIGKVGFPIEVLHHQGPLEDGQRQMFRTHPKRGAELLRALDPDDRVAKTVLYHHERPDGEGYYGKLEGVPRAAAVLAVAEAYDAMTSSKVRETMEPVAALDRLKEIRGEAYDADCVDALIDALRPRAKSIPLSPVR